MSSNSVGQNQISSIYTKPVQQQNIGQVAPAQPETTQMPAPAVVDTNYNTIPQVSAYPPQGSIYPQAGQNVNVPNYSGVNIQIFNPSVTPPGAQAPTYNVNAPSYATNPQCAYPANYYTQPLGAGANNSQNTTTTTTNTTTNVEKNKKTEKRQIVQLTDEYIKNLEGYLNSQDKELRYMGAKEVVARLEEDDSRKDDKALTALINKMLQDPSSKIRFLAMAALQSRMVSGDPLTAQILTNMQNTAGGYGEDSLMASDILLKMSGQTVEKEFEVKNDKKDKK